MPKSLAKEMEHQESREENNLKFAYEIFDTFDTADRTFGLNSVLTSLDISIEESDLDELEFKVNRSKGDNRYIPDIEIFSDRYRIIILSDDMLLLDTEDLLHIYHNQSKDREFYLIGFSRGNNPTSSFAAMMENSEVDRSRIKYMSWYNLYLLLNEIIRKRT